MTDERHPPSFLALAGGGHVAYRFLSGRSPTVVFLCGYGSEVTRFIEEGRERLQLRGRIPLDCPVRLIHGYRDEDVPWQTSLRLAARLRSSDVTVEIVSDGDHRLSRDVDLVCAYAARRSRRFRGVIVSRHRRPRRDCPAHAAALESPAVVERFALAGFGRLRP